MPELLGVALEAGTHGRTRVVGEVRALGTVERYWYDVPPDLAEGLDSGGDAWLVALLPLAVTLQTPLRVSLPVQAGLVSNLRRVMDVWASWYPGRDPVPLEVDASAAQSGRGEGRTGAFFSGGVDSFYTVLGHAHELDDLITLEGFDIALGQTAALERLRERHRRIAEKLDTRPVFVATNLRETGWRRSDWAMLAHGCALASVALLLGGRYERVLLAASTGYHDPKPWGSHPRTDPLLSSSRTRIVPDGAIASRLQKLRRVAASPLALEELRVCWRSGTDLNCGRCGKCYRTMVALELLDALAETRTFQADRVDPRLASRIYAGIPWHVWELEEMAALARVRERHDLVTALERALGGSRRLGRTLELLAALESRGILRRWAGGAQERLLERWLR